MLNNIHKFDEKHRTFILKDAADLPSSSLPDQPTETPLHSADEEICHTAEPCSTPTVLGEYEISELLGSGGMGVVYKARHVKLNKTVALKMLHPHLAADAVSVKRFGIEARAASMLTHANLIAVYESGVATDGQPYIVMDYIPGKGLDQIIRDEGFMELTRFYHVFRQVCEALEHAHDKGVIHRDIKPSNIMIMQKGADPEYVKVLDFGIARVLQQAPLEQRTVTQSQTIVGSPAYMSPEQCLGQPLDARSDIYSLGVVMYEALTGKTPFSGENPIQVIVQQVRDHATPLLKLRPDLSVPEALESLIMRALDKDPQNRFESVREILDQLICLAEGRSLPKVPPPRTWTKAKDWAIKFITGSGARFCLSAIFAFGAAYWLNPNFHPAPPQPPLPIPTLQAVTIPVQMPPKRIDYQEESKLSKPAWSEVERLLKLGNTALSNEDWGEAVTVFNNATQLATQLNASNSQRVYVLVYAADALSADVRLRAPDSTKSGIQSHLRQAAEDCYYKALDLLEKSHNAAGWITLWEKIESNDIIVNMDSDKYAELQEKQLRLLQEHHYPAHKIVWTSDNLGKFYEESGRAGQAESTWLVAARTMKKSNASTLPGPADHLADLYHKQGRYQEERDMRKFAVDCNYPGFLDGSYELSMMEPEFKSWEAILRQLGDHKQADAVASRFRNMQKHKS